MNIHEYQARELFAKFAVATQPGGVAFTPEDAEAVAANLGGRIVVKAQIHAGGRGKGTFKNGYKGGVHLCDTPAEARDIAARMLGQVLVTHQTGPDGKEVAKVFVGEAVDITRELYFAILLDRATSAPIVIASTEGGVDIESVAEHTPEKILRLGVNPALGQSMTQQCCCDGRAADVGRADDEDRGTAVRLTTLRPTHDLAGVYS
jgi:succinyl-CoA synthetase beta subunit